MSMNTLTATQQNLKVEVKPQPLSIRRQLLGYMFTSIFVLLMAFSITVIFLTQKSANKIVVENAQEVTRALAQQSTLALLTESAENAEAALNQVRSFPDVVGAGLVTMNGELLGWQGEASGQEFFASQDWSKIQLQSDMLFAEDENHWYIASISVLVGDEDADSELNLFEVSDQRLGYAVVSFSKRGLGDINKELFVIISITGLIAIVGLPLIISMVLRRLLQPLQRLSAVMVHNHETGEHKVALVEGAKEVQQMAESFNAMIQTLDEQDEKLRHHRDQLEAEVNIRTQELVVARDAALTSSRYKSEFLANVTHELRSPIQSIIGYVELVREEAENEGLVDIQHDLDKVTRNAERLFVLINSVLDLSKIEAGKMELTLQSIYLDELLVGLEDATAPLVPKNNNRLHTEVRCGNPMLRVDHEKVLQVLINLLSNACKFTENGKITLEVEMQGKFIVFIVTDTGIGIPADKLESVFQKFQQIDGSEARRVGGTGLGLAISRQFSELMNGTLTVESTLNKGSVFTFKIPSLQR